MDTHLAVTFGSLATVLFVISQAPMLVKAARTKDVKSYSGANLVIANLGNAAQAVYVITFPPGPLWALHAFNSLTTGCMLFWWVRFRDRRAAGFARPGRGTHGGAADQATGGAGRPKGPSQPVEEVHRSSSLERVDV